MKISICTDAVFRGMRTEEAIPLARAAGAEYIEFWDWWEKDLNAIEFALKKNSLSLEAICTRFIPLTDPSCRKAYLEGLRETVIAAQKLGCHGIISQVGDDQGTTHIAQHNAVTAGLKEAAKIVEEAEMTLLFEPLNTLVNHPGYFLTASEEAFQIADEVNSPSVKVLFDIYHQQISEGNILRNILPNIQKIGHFHAAGIFGRHELDDGELNYPYIFKKIYESGYDRFFGLEYYPAGDPAEGLKRVLASLTK